MSYIEVSHPRGYDPQTLFFYPYEEARRNLSSCVDQPTLLGRVKHALVGVLLLIPIINTLAFIILRAAFAFPIQDDEPRVEEVDETPPAIVKLNNRRRQLDAEIETKAVEYMTLIHTDEIRAHLKMSEERNRALLEKDGQTPNTDSWLLDTEKLGFSQASFTQVGGVHQYSASNQLCGYYALFYLHQEISGERAFADRDMLHPMLECWTTLMAKKRALHWIQCHRDKEIPAALHVSVRGLQPGDFEFLIENDPALNCLQNQTNCHVMDMEEWRTRGELIDGLPYSKPLSPIGCQVQVNRFPLYLILKEGTHYYFVWATEPWEFKVVHSMGWSVINKSYKKTFLDIVHCILTELPENQPQ